jgi:tetratricopeptide (TPR) repeat protein
MSHLAPEPGSGPVNDDDALAAAIRRHEERLARDPGSLAFAQLADLYRKAGRAGEAVATCRAGLARYPHYVTGRLILAKSLVADGAVDDALAEIATILATSPNDVQARRLAADLERAQGRVDAAAEHLEVVARLDPADKDSRAVLGLLRADPSAPDTTGLARVLRDDTFVTPTFGALCLDQGAADEAALVFTRILRKDPHHPAARAGLETALRARSRRRT